MGGRSQPAPQCNLCSQLTVCALQSAQRSANTSTQSTTLLVHSAVTCPQCSLMITAHSLPSCNAGHPQQHSKSICHPFPSWAPRYETHPAAGSDALVITVRGGGRIHCNCQLSAQRRDGIGNICHSGTVRGGHVGAVKESLSNLKATGRWVFNGAERWVQLQM